MKTASSINTPPGTWLFVHYGEAPLRGSERCLLNLLQARCDDGLRGQTVLWCNQPALAEAAAPWVDAVVVDAFALGPGFTSSLDRSALKNLPALVAHGTALVRRHGVRLIHCSGLAPCQWMMPVSLLCRVPLVAQLHSNYLPAARVASLAYGASLLIGVSRFCVQDFRSDGMPGPRVSVVHNGVNIPAFTHSREAVRVAIGLPEQALVLASIGALDKRKRVDLLLDAICELPPPLRVRIHLLVVGDGPESQALHDRAVGLPVTFTGWRSDIGDILNASDAVIVACDREAFGLTVIEGAALGKPAIVANAGGLPEVVEEGVTGLRFQAGSAQACAECIQRLLEEPYLLARLGHQAQSSYLRRFTLEHMTRQIFELNTLQQKEGSSAFSQVWRFCRLAALTVRTVVRRVVAR